MHNLITECRDLSEAAIEFLKTIEQQMCIVADLSRADILIYCCKSKDEMAIVSHARPHSLAYVYTKSREGRIVNINHRPEILQALLTGKKQKEQHSFIFEGAPVVRLTIPIHFPPQCMASTDDTAQPDVIAVLAITTNLIEYERHRLRNKVFRHMLKRLQSMLLCGHIIGAEKLTPFGEHDGIIYVDNEGVIGYASGIAVNLYRRIGYKEKLIGRPLTDLEAGDDELRRKALAQKQCLEWEVEEANRYWIHKVLPLTNYPSTYRTWLKYLSLPSQSKPGGVLILLHDDTEVQRRARELRIKNAMIQEVHHRVKNNLQTIAGLLRMRSRRVKTEEARQVLDEALNRILSVAVIHEFLSNDSSNIINIKEISTRIINQLQGMLSFDQSIKMEVLGDSIRLPARQATACSLIINELIQNSLEHGFEDKKQGIIRVNLEDNGEEVIIKVADDGDGVPDSFQMDQADSLGLYIVKILVEGDLQGQIQLESGLNGSGLGIKIVFSKKIFGGEEGWKEHVSL